MQLTAEQFKDLTNFYATGRKVAGEKERRRSSRMDVQARVPVSLIEDGERLPPVPIMVRDLSPRGIRILHPEPLRLGQQFVIELKGVKQGITLLCTVIHVEQPAGGLYSVGAEFTCAAPERHALQSSDQPALKRIRSSMLD